MSLLCSYVAMNDGRPEGRPAIAHWGTLSGASLFAGVTGKAVED